MVAEGYLGQLEAASNPRCRLDLVESDSSTSSTGSDEMMQGAATDPLSSPEVVTDNLLAIITILSFAVMSSTMTSQYFVFSRLTNVSVPPFKHFYFC